MNLHPAPQSGVRGAGVSSCAPRSVLSAASLGSRSQARWRGSIDRSTSQSRAGVLYLTARCLTEGHQDSVLTFLEASQPRAFGSDPLSVVLGEGVRRVSGCSFTRGRPGDRSGPRAPVPTTPPPGGALLPAWGGAVGAPSLPCGTGGVPDAPLPGALTPVLPGSQAQAAHVEGVLLEAVSPV